MREAKREKNKIFWEVLSRIKETIRIVNRQVRGITSTKDRPEIYERREIEASKNRDIRTSLKASAGQVEKIHPAPSRIKYGTGSLKKEGENAVTSKIIIKCPYCLSEDFVKRGTRKKKREVVQLYLCRSCRRTFTPFSTKGKHYPLQWILEALSYYNLGFSLEQTCKIIKEKSREKSEEMEIRPSTLNNWVQEFSSLCAYSRMRPFGTKMYSPYEIVETCTLAHRQLYRFRFHRAKIRLIIEEDFKHYRFGPLREFLELVSTETPHQYFQEGLRASEAPLKFSKAEMIVRNKQNYATRLAEFVLQGVKDNKQRHETLQRFMLANDSVTVATEIPVYIKREDLEHMKTQLGFELYIKNEKREIKEVLAGDLPKLITGHIDFLQIRNGLIHILDYKSNAAKEKPIEQLTLYALALSRLTGLRLYCFKCAWFDEKDYFEFFPLHVVYKRKKGRRKNIKTKEGVYKINQNFEKMENIRPVPDVVSEILRSK